MSCISVAHLPYSCVACDKANRVYLGNDIRLSLCSAPEFCQFVRHLLGVHGAGFAGETVSVRVKVAPHGPTQNLRPFIDAHRDTPASLLRRIHLQTKL